MKVNILFFLFFIFFLTNCSNECDNVSCLNGTCQDGTCFCQDGWGGEDCGCRLINCGPNGEFSVNECNCSCFNDCVGESCEICPELITFEIAQRIRICLLDHILGDRDFDGNGP